MNEARWYTGDTLEVLPALAADGVQVDLVVTSPPFLALRSYLDPDDSQKAREIGNEPSPGEFIDALLDVVELCADVLAPWGSMCFQLGDSMSGSGGAGGDYLEGGWREGQNRFAGSAGRDARPARLGRESWPGNKSHALIPELFRIALAYGFNPLTGRETDRWLIRNVVTWCKPNPTPGALGDKWRPATSDFVVFTKNPKRYWDDYITRTPVENPNKKATATLGKGSGRETATKPARVANAAGAPLLDWWTVTSPGYKGAHYATFPPNLIAPLIRAMCPERVCRTCDTPSERIILVESTTKAIEDPTREVNKGANGAVHSIVDRGWTDCGHDDWRPGIVLDPFAGSGTTGQVSTGHSRDAILIDLDPANLKLARERCGFFLCENGDNMRLGVEWLCCQFCGDEYQDESTDDARHVGYDVPDDAGDVCVRCALERGW